MKKTCLVLFLTLLFLLPFRLFAQGAGVDALSTDAPMWRQALGGAAIGRPVAQVQSVVVATDGGNVLSFSSQGRPLWNFFARGRLTPYISRSREGTTYLGRLSGQLIAINRVGRELWQVDLGSPLVTPVLIGWDGRLFAFTSSGITAMTASGYRLWSFSLYSPLALPPVLDTEGGIIAVKSSGELLRFDPFGNVVTLTLGTVPAAITPLKLNELGHAILLLHANNNIEIIYNLQNANSPHENVSIIRLPIVLPSPPAAALGLGNQAVVLMRNGNVALIAPQQGEVLWVSQSHIRAGELPMQPGTLDVDIFALEQRIYVLTQSGASAFLEDGRRLWLVSLRGAASIPSFGDDGVLFSGGNDWILNAYRLEHHIRSGPAPLHAVLPPGAQGTANLPPSSLAHYFFRFEEDVIRARFQAIRAAVSAGAIGSDELEYTAWLKELAGSLLPNPPHPRSPSRSLPDIHHRVHALYLLAYMGSRHTIPFLTELFRSDPEPLVQAAAALAIGRIGVDPDGIAIRAFSQAVLPPFAVRNDAVLTAIAAATGSLCRFSGPPLSAIGVSLLTILAGHYEFPHARRQARAEMRSLTM